MTTIRPKTISINDQNTMPRMWFDPVTGSDVVPPRADALDPDPDPPVPEAANEATATVVVVAPAIVVVVVVVAPGAVVVVDASVVVVTLVVVVVAARVVVVALVVVVTAADVDVAATDVEGDTVVDVVGATVVDVVGATVVEVVGATVVDVVGATVVDVVVDVGDTVVLVVVVGATVVVVVVVVTAGVLLHRNCEGPPLVLVVTKKSVVQNRSVTPAFVQAIPILYAPCANVPGGNWAKLIVWVPMIIPFGSALSSLFTTGAPPVDASNEKAGVAGPLLV